MIRTVRGRIEDPPNAPQSFPVPVPLADVEAAAFKELIRNRTRGIGVRNLMQSLLAASPELIWAGDGFGNGIEMRRSFSAIFGRFFARWFAESYLGYSTLIPISGSPFPISTGIAVRRSEDPSSDLPDWIGISNGKCMFCEAKGSSDKTHYSNATFQPLERAKAQISSAWVDFERPARSRKLSGWAIMSRWGIEEPPREPLLYAIDPPPDEHPMNEKEESILIDALLQLERHDLFENMDLPSMSRRFTSLPDGASIPSRASRYEQSERRFSRPTGDLPPPASDTPEIVELEIDGGPQSAIGRLFSTDARPLNLSIRDALNDDRLNDLVVFVGMDEKSSLEPLDAFRERIVLESSSISPQRIDRGSIDTGYVSASGLVISNLSKIRRADRYD